ncbi:coiled-coil domain-containing protein 42-like [Cuculus canorus]|uniref:coiled-coil domain-containing protein 42-like n=1 Tax=Cuculus canorus TaxID=55661 RepID=UPI0023AAD7F4|nr:coiled-coil domain-containing protein 42-like [Cuculus canorus]
MQGSLIPGLRLSRAASSGNRGVPAGDWTPHCEDARAKQPSARQGGGPRRHLGKNSTGRKLHLKEDYSLASFIKFQKINKEAQQMEVDLVEAREDFMERMGVIAQRWRDLHAREAQLKAHVETSEETLKERAGMRIHTLKKARKEREKKMQMERELVRAEETLEALKNQHHKLSKKVQKFSIFKDYLEEVVKVSEFKDIQELIEHNKTLMRMCKDQLRSQKVHKEMSEQAQVLLDQHMAEKEAEIQQHQNELKQLLLCFDQAQRDVQQWVRKWGVGMGRSPRPGCVKTSRWLIPKPWHDGKTVLADIQDTATKKVLELGTIKLTILNLFRSLSAYRKAHLKVSQDDSLRQLDMIQHFIQDFADLCLEEKQKDRRNSQEGTCGATKGHPSRTCSARRGSAGWEETVLADIQDTATKKDLELGTIKLTILKLFRSLSAYRKAHLKVSQDDSLRQLDMIQHFIQDFADLCLEEKQKDRRNSQEGTCGATRDTPAGPALPAEAQQGGK